MERVNSISERLKEAFTRKLAGDFAKAYACGQYTMRLKAREVLRLGCSPRAEALVRAIARRDVRDIAAEAREAEVEWKGRLSGNIRERLYSAYEGFRRAADDVCATYIRLMGYVASHAGPGEERVVKLMGNSLAFLRDRRIVFIIDAPHGYMSGQIDMLLGCADEVHPGNEVEYCEVLHCLSDGKIPFALSPDCLEDWSGSFSDIQSRAFWEAVEANGEMADQLRERCMDLSVERHIDKLTRHL